MNQAFRLAVVIMFAMFYWHTAYGESPRTQLKQMVEQLQQNPNDEALREQIIHLASNLKPALKMPEEAERRMARGTEAFKEAKSISDYQAAVQEFQLATLAAPWSVDAYFNLGLAQDKAEDFEGSLRSLKLAMLASPDSKDIKDLYYKVEYQRDKAAEQNSAVAKEEARQAAEAASQAAVYQGLDGGVWTLTQLYYDKGNGFEAYPINAVAVHNEYEIHGNQIEFYQSDDLNPRSRRWQTTFTSRHFHVNSNGDSFEITISDDGQTITREAIVDSSYWGGGFGATTDSRSVYQRIK